MPEGNLLNTRMWFGWVAEAKRWWGRHPPALSSPLPQKKSLPANEKRARYGAMPRASTAIGQMNISTQIDLKDSNAGRACDGQIGAPDPVHLPFGTQIAAWSASYRLKGYIGILRAYRLYPDFFGDCHRSRSSPAMSWPWR